MSGYDTVADTIREHRDQALAAAAERAAKAAPGLLIGRALASADQD